MVTSSGRLTLWGVEVFVATVEETTVSAAAKRLETSPATVSQQLTNLENAIGVTLLNRGARPVTLTPAGEMFLRRANVILNEAEQARLELARSDFTKLTRLRMGMIEDFETEVTPRLLTTLSNELPSCQFLLETGASHRLHDMLDNRALDIVVGADLAPVPSGFERHALLQEPFIVAAPKGTIGDDILADLTALPMIQYTTRHYMGRKISNHLDREGFVFPHRFELDSYHAIMSLVATGAGWTILTPLAWLRTKRLHSEIEAHPLPFAAIDRTISLTSREDSLGDTPQLIAQTLRCLLAEHVVSPTTDALPWLKDTLRIL